MFYTIGSDYRCAECGSEGQVSFTINPLSPLITVEALLTCGHPADRVFIAAVIIEYAQVIYGARRN